MKGSSELVHGGVRRGIRTMSLALLVGAALSNACTASSQDKKPEPPPVVPIVATGDGQAVGGYFGVEGGQIKLGPAGPSVIVPKDPKRTTGVALGLKKDAGPPLPTGAKALGDAFRSSALFEPPSHVFVDVWSIEMAALPPPCTPDNLELAVQEPPQVGPSDGASSPALAWRYERARWDDGRAKAQLPRLAPYPLQFVCARGAGGGT